MSNKPPKVTVPGLSGGVPAGYILGRPQGTGRGPVQLLNLAQLRRVGVRTAGGSSADPSQSTSLSQISSSLSGAISSTTSLSSAVSTVDSNQSTSISSNLSRVTSLSTAVSTVDSGQGASLSQIKTAGGSLKIPVTTVAGLPSAATEGAGALRAVSDALTPTLGVIVVGGGSVYTIVLSDGANWIAN